jgi:6-pyruvoyltetrahydropterin/6-carboxytetrahydropterin synthase
MERYFIRISGGEMVFSAAHFITLADNQCEPLHGHDYQVAVEIGGALGPQQYVADFTAARAAVRAILAEMEHRVLLPDAHPAIRLAPQGERLEVTCGTHRWCFPQEDCQVLAVSNTTAELLARYIGQRLLAALRAELRAAPSSLRIELSESPGQAAVWQWTEPV